MFRCLLPVAVILILAGCNCSALGCDPPEGDWDTSSHAAGDLWEIERNRTERRPSGDAMPDTTEVPDTLSFRPV